MSVDSHITKLKDLTAQAGRLIVLTQRTATMLQKQADDILEITRLLLDQLTEKGRLPEEEVGGSDTVLEEEKFSLLLSVIAELREALNSRLESVKEQYIDATR